MIITGIKPARKVTSVFFEDESSIVVYTDIFNKYGYKENDDIPFEVIKEIE